MESAQAYIDNLFSVNNDEIKNAAYDYKHSRSGSDKYAKSGAGAGLSLAPGAGGLEGGADLSAPGQSTKQTSGGGSSMPTRGARPSGRFVASGNSWSGN